MPEDDVEDEDDELADDAEQDEDAADGEEAAPRPKPKRKRKRKKTTPIERPVRDPRQREVHEVTSGTAPRRHRCMGVALIIVALAVISSKGEMTTGRVCGIPTSSESASGSSPLGPVGAVKGFKRGAYHVFALILRASSGCSITLPTQRRVTSENKAHAPRADQELVADLKQQVRDQIVSEAMWVRASATSSPSSLSRSKNLKVSLIDPRGEWRDPPGALRRRGPERAERHRGQVRRPRGEGPRLPA